MILYKVFIFYIYGLEIQIGHIFLRNYKFAGTHTEQNG
jgi:hypothetical protein